MLKIIQDRINKLDHRLNANLEGMMSFDEEIGTYHIRAEEQNKIIKDELTFLGELLASISYDDSNGKFFFLKKL